MMIKRPLIGPAHGGEYRPLWPLALGCLLPAALAAVYFVLRTIPGAAQKVIDGFAFPVRQFLSRISACVPFSIMEVLYVLFGLWVVAFLVRSVVLICRGRRKWRILLRRVLILLLVALCLWSVYCWLWGFDYYGAGFVDKTSLTGRAAAPEELEDVAAYFLERANALAGEIQRDENLSCSLERKALFDDAPRVYDAIAQEFDCLNVTYYTPKPMFFSRVMSATGFTGVYFPFTGESNINMDAPASLTAFVIAHELAHQSGIAAEQEANFVAVAACAASGITEYVYAGCLGGLIYTMNAMIDTDPEAWQRLRDQFSPELERDWLDNIEYWQGYESAVENLSENMYDAYLKSNGQEMGMASYGACVDLLVEYFLPAARAGGDGRA